MKDKVKIPANPKARAGAKKLTMTNVPISMLVHNSFPMNDGAAKYTKYNWIDKDKGLDMMTYIDAVYRHITLFMAGEDCAEDSGRHHLDHIMSGVCVLRDAMMLDNVTDNRVKYPPLALKRLKLMMEGKSLEDVIKEEKD